MNRYSSNSEIYISQSTMILGALCRSRVKFLRFYILSRTWRILYFFSNVIYWDQGFCKTFKIDIIQIEQQTQFEPFFKHHFQYTLPSYLPQLNKNANLSLFQTPCISFNYYFLRIYFTLLALYFEDISEYV